MKYLIISFKNRNSLMAFNKILTNRGIATSVINTPRSIAISCGLSLKTDKRNLNLIINLVHYANINGFIGIYLYDRTNGYEQIRQIY